jgi:hypothetical protein
MNCYCLHLITLIHTQKISILSTGLPNQQELVPLLNQGLGSHQHKRQPEFQQMAMLYLSIFPFSLFWKNQLHEFLVGQHLWGSRLSGKPCCPCIFAKFSFVILMDHCSNYNKL